MFLEKMCLGMLQFLHSSYAKPGVIRMILMTQLVQAVRVFHAAVMKFVTSQVILIVQNMFPKASLKSVV